MKTINLILSALLCVGVSGCAKEKDSVDPEVFYRATVINENWDGKTPGASGEWGPAQLLPSTWKSIYPDVDQRSESGALHEPWVAVTQIKWCINATRKLGLPITPFTVALVYGAGFGNVKENNITKSKLEYARRTENIYREIMAGRNP